MKHIKTPVDAVPWATGQADILDSDGNLILLPCCDEVATEVIQAVNAHNALVAACRSWVAWAETECEERGDGSLILPPITGVLAYTRAALAAIEKGETT